MKNKKGEKMNGEERNKAKAWFNFLEILQEKPIEVWSEDVSRVFNLIDRYKPEKIYHRIIRGIPVIVIIHSTKRGSASGGTRILPYKNMAEAIFDALRLSSGMTYKAVWARLPVGGGKSVIWASPQEITKRFLRGYAKFLNEINTSRTLFTTGEDIGFTEEFTDYVAKYSPYLVGKSPNAGGLGDPSPITAKGIFLATKTVVEKGQIFEGTLKDKEINVQGAGKVALPLMKMLLEEGARVYFSENDGNISAEERAKMAIKLGAERIAKEDFFQARCHILMPCAVGGIINKSTIPLISSQCRLIMGAANNILDTPEDGIELHKEKRIYLPDYVVNRYGLEWVSQENKGITDPKVAERNLTDISKDVLSLLELSKIKDMAISEIADTISKKVLAGSAQSIEEAFAELTQ